MNGNDLFDALSGLDNTYIDEAAFELHGTPASKQKKAKIVKIRKTLLVVIPSAAAILLVVALALPFAISHKSSESASFAPSAPAMDTAAEAPAEEAAAEAAEDVMSEAPAADYAAEAEAPAMDTEAEAPAMAESAGAQSEAADESYSYDAAETENAEPAATLTADADRRKTAGTTALFESADYSKGILTIETSGILPKNFEDMTYQITGTDNAGNEKEYSTGIVKDIMTATEPLALDISELNLAKGTYSIRIGEESISFEFR